MIRLYYADGSGHKDFEKHLFSGNKAEFDFANDKVIIDGDEFFISNIIKREETIYKCQYNDQQDMKDEFDIINDMLDSSFEYTRTHNLDTLTPIIILYDGNGVKQGESEIGITRLDSNTVKFSFFGSITGSQPWSCEIKP